MSLHVIGALGRDGTRVGGGTEPHPNLASDAYRIAWMQSKEWEREILKGIGAIDPTTVPIETCLSDSVSRQNLTIRPLSERERNAYADFLGRFLCSLKALKAKRKKAKSPRLCFPQR